MDEQYRNELINRMELESLMRSLNIVNPTPSNVFATNVDGLTFGTRIFDNLLNPFIGIPTSAGTFELEQKPDGKDTRAKLTRKNAVGEGVLTSEVSKGLNNPEMLAKLLYQQPLYGGELSTQATYGTGTYNEPVSKLELQYLREILKNLGAGAYFTQTPQGASGGLRIQGRF